MRKFFNSPSSIGSIVPSSPALVASMMTAIDWPQSRVIVELGAGTGVMTRSINDSRSDDSVFITFEKDEQMHRELELRFPDVLIDRDAFQLTEVLALHGYHEVDCIISCLPFANFDRVRQLSLVSTIYDHLHPGGLFLAFQYSPQLQSCLKTFYKEVDCRFVIKNLPPAIVYVCRKSR
jgi:phospholipid N-methyltransferase